MPLKIEVYTTQEPNPDWIILSGIGKYLTEKQMVPNAGDAIAITPQDGEILGITSGSMKHIMTVKKRLMNYSSADIALILHYEGF